MNWEAPQGYVGEGAIRARLIAPEAEATVEELAACWFAETIELTIEGYGKLASDPGLPGRIRGAFGEALMAGASAEALAGKPCIFDPPSAFEVLFRKQGRMTKEYEFPSPWVMGVSAKGSSLLLNLTLFGFASDWMPAAAEALTRAATELTDWKGRTGLFLPPLKLTSRITRHTRGVSYPAAPPGVEIAFLSPLAMSGHDPRQQPVSLLTGLGARLSGLARWHGLSLDMGDVCKSIKRAANQFHYVFEEVEEAGWNRGSERQNRRIPMRGIVCHLEIRGELAPAAAVLALGETCHMGADVAFGCGRYRILSWH